MYHILLIDDDPDMVEITKRWLIKEYEVDTALSGEEALSFLSDNAVDLILLDFHMPDITGEEMVKRIRGIEGQKDVKIVILSGIEEGIDTEALGVTDFLSKAGGKKALLAALEGYFSL